MKILKLPWLEHQEQRKKFEIYSLSVSPDGKRLASGGLDGHVRLWSVETIRQFATNPNKEIDKSECIPLCSMSRHSGAVTTVKFSPSGRFLATGSDDKVVLIWEKDEDYIPTMNTGFDSDHDKEHWVVRKRLVAHDNDVQDIAWSPDSNLLVTAGLDRSIIVWNGTTFEKIKRFELHNSHVKGVVFDPANKYFATASDDRSVIVFHCHRSIQNETTFSVESRITKPFKSSPLTTYFRRLSWSPDGQHIAVPNAANGPVSSVCVINRGDWNSDISLIGHSAPSEVVKFSPRLYRPDPEFDDVPKSPDSLASVIATGGQDKTLVVWKTNSPRPLLIANDMAFKTLSDMAWSPDGHILFVSSLDGSITSFFFEKDELGKEVPLIENDKFLHRYGAESDAKVFPESVSQLLLESKVEQKPKAGFVIDKRMDSLMDKTVSKMQHTKKQISSTSASKAPKLMKQNVSITKSGKKRVAPTLLTSVSSSINKQATELISTSNTNELEKSQKSFLSVPLYSLGKSGIKSLVWGVREHKQHESENENSASVDIKKKPISRMRKIVDYPEFLLDLVTNSLQNIAYVNYASYTGNSSSSLVIPCYTDLETPQLSLHIQNNYEEDKSDDTETFTRVVSTDLSESKRFEVFFPSNIINGVAMPEMSIWILASEVGNLHFLSFEGKIAFSKLEVGGNICVLRVSKTRLLVVVHTGICLVWDLKKFEQVAKCSLAPLINQASKKAQNLKVTSCELNSDDLPEVDVDDQTYCWSSDLSCWHIKV